MKPGTTLTALAAALALAAGTAGAATPPKLAEAHGVLVSGLAYYVPSGGRYRLTFTSKPSGQTVTVYAVGMKSKIVKTPYSTIVVSTKNPDGTGVGAGMKSASMSAELIVTISKAA